jgi:thiamine pyrophosphokinase
MSSPTHWSLPFLQTRDEASRSKTALIILNQPFSKALLRRLWHATDWHCCADGGANRLHDVLNGDRGDAIDTTTTATTTTASGAADRVDDYLPDLLKGDLDSVREDVRRYYETRVSRCSTHFLLLAPARAWLFAVCRYYIIRSHVSVLFRKGVRVVRDDDQYSTDLMKCIQSLQEKEEADGVDVGGLLLPLCTRFRAI